MRFNSLVYGFHSKIRIYKIIRNVSNIRFGEFESLLDKVRNDSKIEIRAYSKVGKPITISVDIVETQIRSNFNLCIRSHLRKNHPIGRTSFSLSSGFSKSRSFSSLTTVSSRISRSIFDDFMVTFKEIRSGDRVILLDHDG